jgi:predicted esterase
MKIAISVCMLALCAACSGDDGAMPGAGTAGAGGAGGTGGVAGAGAGGAGGSGGAGGASGAGGAGGTGGGSSGTGGDHGDDDAGALPGDGGGDDPIDRMPIDPPVPDDCITDVSAGDHSVTCEGLTYLVLVPEACTTHACGLIFDVHGGTMSGAQMRDNTHLHELAPPHGYIVVHPSATPENTGGSWDLAAQPPLVGEFMDRMIAAFHVDMRRVHVTGFSQGSGMTFWFLCNKPELLTSAAPISGQSADAITAPGGGNCLASIDDSWQPRVPILFMSGTSDTALVIEDARARVDGLVERLGLGEGTMIGGDEAYRRTRYEGDDGMVLEYLEHDYGGQAVLGGHCIPGGTDIAGSANNFGLNATTCTTGEINIHWGEVALEWFLANEQL